MTRKLKMVFSIVCLLLDHKLSDDMSDDSNGLWRDQSSVLHLEIKLMYIFSRLILQAQSSWYKLLLTVSGVPTHPLYGLREACML